MSLELVRLCRILVNHAVRIEIRPELDGMLHARYPPVAVVVVERDNLIFKRGIDVCRLFVPVIFCWIGIRGGGPYLPTGERVLFVPF